MPILNLFIMVEANTWSLGCKLGGCCFCVSCATTIDPHNFATVHHITNTMRTQDAYAYFRRFPDAIHMRDPNDLILVEDAVKAYNAHVTKRLADAEPGPARHLIERNKHHTRDSILVHHVKVGLRPDDDPLKVL